MLLIVEESAARIGARQHASTIVPDYVAPTEPIPEAARKTDEHFRRLDAARRRKRALRRP